MHALAGLYAGLARAVDNTGLRLLTALLTPTLQALVQSAAACHTYPEAMHAVLIFLRDYSEVHVSSLGVSQRLRGWG